MLDLFARDCTPATRVAILIAIACAILGLAPFLGRLDPVRTADAQLATASCTHQGRDPDTVHVSPESSSTYIDCAGSMTFTSGPVSGSTVTRTYCPQWVQTGLSYNPAKPMSGVYISDYSIVYEFTITYRCTNPGWLRRFFGSGPVCEESSRVICQSQLNVLADGLCPQVTGQS